MMSQTTPHRKKTIVHRMPDEHRSAQINHVDKNCDSVRFNAKSVKFLPDNKKYLLGDANGPIAVEN